MIGGRDGNDKGNKGEEFPALDPPPSGFTCLALIGARLVFMR
jgi:hypothetical protein